jgi:hypothetical protein
MYIFIFKNHICTENITHQTLHAYKRAAKRPATIKKPAALLEDAAPVKATVEFFGPPGKTPVADPVLYGLVATVVAGQLAPPGQTAAEVEAGHAEPLQRDATDVAATHPAPLHPTTVEATPHAEPTHGTAVEAGHDEPEQTGADDGTPVAETQGTPLHMADEAPVGTPVEETHGTPLHMATEVAVKVTVL